MEDFFLEEADFNRTVREIDFTRKAIGKIHSVVTAEDFADMDVDRIFHFLFSEMELVSFKDYLKRYIYERIGFDESFREVTDETYARIIMDSFDQNRAPHSFTPTTVKWRAAVKRWLEQDNVQRSTVFLLGFGLRMKAEEVTAFLTKVLKEADYDFSDPWETICWFCFKNDLRYMDALRFMEYYQNGHARLFSRTQTVESLKEKNTENVLKDYLSGLRSSGLSENHERLIQHNFESLYRQVQDLIAQMYQDDEIAKGSDKVWRAEDIGPADVEKVLCDGIPTTKNGNLQKMSKSLLNRHFSQKRITRQRLDKLLKKELNVERYDLITLQFFISSQNEDDEPQVRCRYFLDDINDILEECGMMKLYPVNPYEAFILMCLLTDMPLLTYYDVWQKSYET